MLKILKKALNYQYIKELKKFQLTFNNELACLTDNIFQLKPGLGVKVLHPYGSHGITFHIERKLLKIILI